MAPSPPGYYVVKKVDFNYLVTQSIRVSQRCSFLDSILITVNLPNATTINPLSIAARMEVSISGSVDSADFGHDPVHTKFANFIFQSNI